MFNPVVESTEKSTKAITEELAPMREEIMNLNEMTAERRQKQTKKRRQEIDEESQLNIVEQYLAAAYDDSKFYRYFSIWCKSIYDG